MPISTHDRTILRDLAKMVSEHAADPIQAERRELWYRHNSLDRPRPMILVFPEGSWRELVPAATMRCETEEARRMERSLRIRAYYRDHILDDTVIEGDWIVQKAVTDSGWGLEPKFTDSPMEHGAWAFDPVINEPADLDKLTLPQVTHDVAETERRLVKAQELFGDILDVRLKGVSRFSVHLMSIYCKLRGLGQVMMDMYDNPKMLHRAMESLTQGYLAMLDQYRELGVLDLNNDATYHSSGGNGYTRELPAPGFDPERVRPCDMWASAEVQELAQVSPDMHYEFATQYERRIIEQFALTGYGCCEDLTEKLDFVLDIPNMRRLSISPWADVERCAERLGNRYIFSWKPMPSQLVGEFDEGLIRDYIQRAVDATRGCVFEMVLKDTHTCQHQPERFTRWTQIAREIAESA
jgi:hypothetical protein